MLTNEIFSSGFNFSTAVENKLPSNLLVFILASGNYFGMVMSKRILKCVDFFQASIGVSTLSAVVFEVLSLVSSAHPIVSEREWRGLGKLHAKIKSYIFYQIEIIKNVYSYNAFFDNI